MLKYAYGSAALLAFGKATRLNANSNENYLFPTETELAETEEHPTPTDLAQTVYRSQHDHTPVHNGFYNESAQWVELFWHDYSGNTVSYGTIAPGGWKGMNTFATHPWSAVLTNGMRVNIDGKYIFNPIAYDDGRTIYIVNQYHTLKDLI